MEVLPVPRSSKTPIKRIADALERIADRNVEKVVEPVDCELVLKRLSANGYVILCATSEGEEHALEHKELSRMLNPDPAGYAEVT